MKRGLLLSIGLIVFIAFAGRALLYWQNLQVTSWYRNPWKNYEIGGKWLSLHLIGWAYDVIPVNRPLQEVMRYWPFKAIVESDHIHLQIL